MSMTSNKPYLIRALYDWIVDNHLTPYLLVDVYYPGVQVPLSYASDGKIILNIDPQACRGLHLEKDRIVFTARFAGQSEQIVVPPGAVMAIYTKENGRGMEFEVDRSELPPPVENKPIPINKKGKPFLTLVKKDEE